MWECNAQSTRSVECMSGLILHVLKCMKLEEVYVLRKLNASVLLCTLGVWASVLDFDDCVIF